MWRYNHYFFYNELKDHKVIKLMCPYMLPLRTYSTYNGRIEIPIFTVCIYTYIYILNKKVQIHVRFYTGF